MLEILLRLLAALGSLTFLVWPHTSNWVNSWWGFFPTAFFFFSFASGIFGWGAFAERKLGGGIAGVYLLSSLIAVAFAMIMGHLGLLGEHYRWAFVLFLLAGIGLRPTGTKQFLWFHNTWLNVLLYFIFFIRFFSAYLPHAHGDPLLYHLAAPRIWNLQNIVRLNTDLPVLYLASTWEYFYLWPQVLLTNSATTVKELILAQIFSQWIHLIWALYGSVFIIRKLLAKFDKTVPEAMEFLFFLAFLFVDSLHWTASLAKNDCGIAFWCLGAMLFITELNARSWLLAGIFAGLALAGKINAILFLIPLAMVITAKFALPPLFPEGRSLNFKRKIQLLASALVGAILGAGPLYLRNWLETKDPFFTMFSKWFPSPWISQSWANHFEAHQPSTHQNLWGMFTIRLGELMHESPAFWLWVALPLVLLHKNSRLKILKIWEWCALFVSSLLLCTFAVGPNAQIRYLGASLWIGALVGVTIFFVIVEQFPKKYSRFAIIALIALFLGLSKLPTHILWKFPKIAPGEPMVLKHTAGAAKAWLRENLKDRLVVISADNETYYLSTVRATMLTERPDIDAATYGKTNLNDFIRGLCESSGAKYLLDSRAEYSLKNRFPAPVWDQAVIFDADGARIYDLTKIQDLIFQKNIGCGRT